MAVGAIPWTSIVAWCSHHGLVGDAEEVLIHVIRTLDVERSKVEAANAAKKGALGGKGQHRR